jgi:hypothetical protein
MLSKLRTVALTGALMTAAIPALTTSADAAWWGRGGWGWGHGWGWGGVGLGLAAGAIVGAALTAPYYGGYYGYGYPSYGYGYGYPAYGYGYGYPSYGDDYASYGYGGYAPAYYGGGYGGYRYGGNYGRRFYAYGGPSIHRHVVHRRYHYAH